MDGVPRKIPGPRTATLGASAPHAVRSSPLSPPLPTKDLSPPRTSTEVSGSPNKRKGDERWLKVKIKDDKTPTKASVFLGVCWLILTLFYRKCFVLNWSLLLKVLSSFLWYWSSSNNINPSRIRFSSTFEGLNTLCSLDTSAVPLNQSTNQKRRYVIINRKSTQCPTREEVSNLLWRW